MSPFSIRSLVAIACLPAALFLTFTSARAGSDISANAYGDPIKTYHTYLRAIQQDDSKAAKSCFTTPDDKSKPVLDIAVGMWVAFHRFNKLVVAKFGARESPYLREDCTDEALGRTIARLSKSTIVAGEKTAELRIAWDKEDGTVPAFMFSEDPIRFRKVGDFWKIDLTGQAGDLEDWTAPGSWGRAFGDGMNLLNETCAAIEAGKLNTWEQVEDSLARKSKVLEEKWRKDHHDP